MKLTLNHLLLVYHTVVTEVIETELVVGTVCDIAVICRTSVVCIHGVKDISATKSHELIYFSVVFRITLSQVIVYRNYVHAFALKGVKIYSQ